MTSAAVVALAARWAVRADELAPYAPAAAEAFRRAAAELEAELRAADAAVLTLEEAAAESGYASDTLRKLVARGTIPNAGERFTPRIRRADLPRKASAPDPAATATDPTGEALRLDAHRRRRASERTSDGHGGAE